MMRAQAVSIFLALASVSCRTIETADSPTPPVIPVRSVTASNTNYAESNVWNLVDGDELTGWRTTGGVSGKLSIQFDFGESYPVESMNVQNASPDTAAGVKQVKVYTSLDGLSWTPVSDQVFALPMSIDGQSHTIPYGGRNARYVKLIVEARSNVGNWGGTKENSRVFGLNEVAFVPARGYIVKPAPNWNALFTRYNGWVGADGIFSIPLSGSDVYAAPSEPRTVFLFSDTFIGKVEPASALRQGNHMVNNTLALLSGKDPVPASLRFIWGTHGDYTLESVFEPAITGDDRVAKSSRYWHQDGVVIDGKLHLLPMVVQDSPGTGGFGFKIVGVDHLSVPLTAGVPDLPAVQRSATPLYQVVDALDTEHIFGCGILDNRRTSVGASGDGFIYIYGYVNQGGKSLLAARVLPDEFALFEAWRYWDGTGWQESPRDARRITTSVSPELSVSYLPSGIYAGKYILVYMKDTLSGIICYRLGDSPVGPFGQERRIYHAPEDHDRRAIFAYNAKAHPHLSEPGELLVSYNVNSTDMSAFNDADIYRPRFVKLIETAGAP